MTDLRPLGGPNWYQRNKGWISPSLEVLTAAGTLGEEDAAPAERKAYRIYAQRLNNATTAAIPA